jgi:hypothetical protein
MSWIDNLRRCPGYGGAPDAPIVVDSHRDPRARLELAKAVRDGLEIQKNIAREARMHEDHRQQFLANVAARNRKHLARQS